MKTFIKFTAITAAMIMLLSTSVMAEKAPFTIGDLYKIKGVSSLKLSPDGKNLLYTVSKYNLAKGKTKTAIYCLNTATGKSKKMTGSKGSSYSPFWSDNSREFYFMSTRSGKSELWEMAIDGGEAVKKGSFGPGISSPVNAGRGKIVFSSSVFPEAMADEKLNKKLGDKLKNGPAQAHLSDTLLYRHWASYREWRYTHVFSLDTSKGKVTPLTKGKYDYPVHNLGSGRGYEVSPDGKYVCVVGNHDPKPANSTNSDLFLIETSKPGKLKNITAANKAFDGYPQFSPNGKYIAYTHHTTPGYESDRKRLAVYNIVTGKTKTLTEDIDNWISEVVWSKDSGYIYFTVQEKGYVPLYRQDIKTGKRVKILGNHNIAQIQIQKKTNKMFFLKSTVGEPREIWSYVPGKKKSLKRVTFVNKAIEEKVDIRPAESHWVEGAAGKKIHVFVVKPHNFDPKKTYPLIINVHGGPQMQWTDSFRGDWQVYPGAGYVLAFPNPHGSAGYGQDFTAAISKDWDGKCMEDILKVTDYLGDLKYVNKERIGAMGWSWGGYAMMWLEGHNDNGRYKALAAMMGVYDLDSMYGATEELWFPEWDLGGTSWENREYYQKASPSSYISKFKTPCLVITGELDYRVPYTQSLQFFTHLQKMNVPSRLLVFKYDGHWPSHTRSMPIYYNAHLEWFHKYLGGGKAPYSTEDMVRNQAFDKK